ncbi:MAG: LysM peptidoglycan-binding domain-containing protein [Anaerolineales bacterium]|nr:MAG: LysM peptidoglycan-binding domain-containing protein [Anaerolineales bacterium]
MSALRQALLGILAAMLSTAILMGSIFLALAESGQKLARAIPPTPLPSVNTPAPGEPTFTASPTPLPTSTPTLQAISLCSPPNGWVQVEVQPGDTIASIAQAYGVSIEALRQANCDYTFDTIPFQTYLNVPLPTITPSFTATSTETNTLEPSPTPRSPRATKVPSTACGNPPRSWVVYIVKGGDTLYKIASSRATTVAELKFYNCLSSDLIHPGDRLYVPYVPTPVPSATKPPPPTTEPPPATTEPPPATTEPPPATTEPPPATTEPPPATTEPPPATTEPPPTEPPPATTEPPPNPGAFSSVSWTYLQSEKS